MRNKPVSQLLIILGLLLLLTLFISKEPGQGTIQTIGAIFSALLIGLGIILGRSSRTQEQFSRVMSWLKRHPTLLEWVQPLMVFIWPLIVFWQLIIPSPLSKTIGNDFIYWYFSYKGYLLANYCQFRIPLWSPAEAAGFPFAANPLTQTFYPLNIPYALYACSKNGVTILSYQVFTILGISIFALGLFYWLRSLRGSTTTALIVSLIIPISYKLIETARFPNAVHTAAWFPWLLLALTRIFQVKKTGSAILWTAVLFLLGFNIVSAGYPYFIYYLIFLVPIYLFLLSVPKFRTQIIENNTPLQWKYILGSILVAGILLLAIGLPYLLEMANVLSQTANRASQSLSWSSGNYSASLKDIVGSAIFPPGAIAEGWYYFGIFSLLVIVFFLASSIRKGNSQESQLFSPGLALIFIAWIGLILYLGWDRNETALNGFWLLLWKYMPGFNRLRVWSRIYIILLPVLAILLQRSLQYYFRLLGDPDRITDSKLELFLCGVFASAILIFQIMNNQASDFTRYWNWMEAIDPNVYIILSCSSIVIFFAVLFYARGRYLNHENTLPFMALIVLFSLLDARGGQISPWIWIQDTNTSYLTKRYSATFDQVLRNKLPARRVEEGVPIPLDGEYTTWASRVSWHFQRYVDFLDQTDDQNTQRQILLGEQDGQFIYFTKDLEYSDIKSFLDNDQVRKGAVSLRVQKYTGDVVEIEIDNPEKGYLTYIDNWDPDWKAYVNGEEYPIQLAFGTFKAVELPPGRNWVEFRYTPFRVFSSE